MSQVDLSFKARARRVIIAVLISYLMVVAGMTAVQRDMVFVPTTSPEVPAAYKYGEGFEIVHTTTEDGLRLEGWYVEGTDPDKPMLIWFHGNAQAHGARTWFAHEYVENGFTVLLAGYRGYGGNPGSPSEEGLYLDAEAWLEYVQTERERSMTDVIIYGESLGSGVAVEMATRYTPRAIVLQAPYTRLTDVAFGRFPFLPVYLLMWDRFESLDKIDRVNVPVIIVHGGQDFLVPTSMGGRLYEAANDPKLYIDIEQAGHNNLYEFDTAIRVKKAFQELNLLRETLTN